MIKVFSRLIFVSSVVVVVVVVDGVGVVVVVDGVGVVIVGAVQISSVK